MLGFSDDRLFHYLTEAGVPFSRLHDTAGPCRIIDETRIWEEVPLPSSLPPYSILVARLG